MGHLPTSTSARWASANGAYELQCLDHVLEEPPGDRGRPIALSGLDQRKAVVEVMNVVEVAARNSRCPVEP